MTFVRNVLNKSRLGFQGVSRNYKSAKYWDFVIKASKVITGDINSRIFLCLCLSRCLSIGHHSDQWSQRIQHSRLTAAVRFVLSNVCSHWLNDWVGMLWDSITQKVSTCVLVEFMTYMAKPSTLNFWIGYVGSVFLANFFLIILSAEEDSVESKVLSKEGKYIQILVSCLAGNYVKVTTTFLIIVDWSDFIRGTEECLQL